MRKFLLAATAFTTIGSSALAADLAVRRPPPRGYVPVVVPLYTWTGCYVGGNAGGLWARTEWNGSVFGDLGTGTASGGLGGLQGGCNYQVGAWVFGIQGDYDWTSINSTSANPALTALANAAFLPGGFAFTDQTQLKSLGSVTGRVGYSWDRFLAYVKAGGAWLQTSYTLQNAGVAIATASSTQSGWTVGVGGEYAFLNWLTGFVEYDYYGFNNSNSGALVCGAAVCGVALAGTGIKENVNVVKAGLNFTFGPGSF